MRKTVVCLAAIFLAAPVFAGGYGYDRYEIRTNPYGKSSSSYNNSTEIEMRKKYDYNTSSRYRGEIESDGTVIMKNFNGDRIRGSIDRDGYGSLRDRNGNTYRVRPR